MNDDPVKAFLNAWQQGHAPDLFSFVQAHPELTDDEILQLVRIDQQFHWRAGDLVRAELYFARLPGLAAREEDALVLLCGEFGLAVEIGHNPTVAGFQTRFPRWSERLGMQLALETALTETLPMSPPTGEEDRFPAGYEILGEIGRGAMGVVYRARHIGLDRLVAIKVLQGTTVASPEQELTVRLEGQLIARLDHPGIVRVFDFDTHEGLPYLAMELTEGGSLAEAMSAGLLGNLRSAALLEQLARAVHHAHQRGVIHRDIKPANILLTRDGDTTDVAKLADFGLARIQTENQPGGQIVGTPRYMAPEQAAREPATAASDIWALGAVFYELLTGQPAFGGRTITETLEQVRSGEPIPVRRINPAVPRDLEAICLRCLRKDPGQRYSSAAALAQDLASWREGRPVSARPLNPFARASRWLWRHPGVAAALAGILGLLVLSIFLGWMLHDRVEQARVEGLVETLCRAEPAEWPRYLGELDRQRARAEPLLRERLAEPDQQIPAALALLPSDSSQADLLLARIPTARPEWLPVMRLGLRRHHERIAPTLWGWLTGKEPASVRLRAACLLAAEQPADGRWNELAPVLVEALLQANPLHLGRWQEELEPIGATLVPELSRRVPTLPRGSASEALATTLLVHWAAEQPETLARLLTGVDGQPYAQFLAALRTHTDRGVSALERYLDAGGHADRSRARAAIGLALLGRGDRLPPLLAHGPNPGLRSELIHRVAPLGMAPATLAPLLRQENEGIRRAVVLALGEFPPDQVTAEHPWLVPWLLDRYENDPDPGLHSGIGWLLRGPWKCLKQAPRLAASDAELARSPASNRRWWHASDGEPYVRIEGATFTMGTPTGEQHRVDSPVHLRSIPRTYLLAANKVTVASFRTFLKAHPKLVYWPADEYSPDASGPIIAVSWYQAAAYCNWLSSLEKLPEAEWCYVPNTAGEYGPGMRPAPDALSRRGYRLPTEAEWEYACRARATTRFPHGSSPDLLGRFAWFQPNADGRANPNGRLKPNDFGVFDQLGNAWEWCHEAYHPYPAWWGGGDNDDSDVVLDSNARILRGGSYVDRVELIHPGLRCPYPPDGKDCSVGFRVARTWNENLPRK